MECIQQSLPLTPVTETNNLPITNVTLPAIDLNPLESTWPYYLGQYPNLAIFNESATEEAARQAVLLCREWDDVCQDPKQLFASSTNLGVCSLYHNLTTAVEETTSRIATVAIQRTETVIPTCLITYCAQERLCSLRTTTNCTTASIISTNGHLSSQGVGRCWAEICESLRPYVNQSIAGLGVRQTMAHSRSRLLTVLVNYFVSYADHNRVLNICISRSLSHIQKISLEDKYDLQYRARLLLRNEVSSCAEISGSA